MRKIAGAVILLLSALSLVFCVGSLLSHPTLGWIIGTIFVGLMCFVVAPEGVRLLGSPRVAVRELAQLFSRGAMNAGKASRKFDAGHIRWLAVAVWICFLLAFLNSDFFIVAQSRGLFAAINLGAAFGALEVNDVGALYSTGISLRLLFGLAVLVSSGLWFWASERNRRAKKQS